MFPCPKEDLEPLPKPLANRWQGDVVENRSTPPIFKVLVWLAKPLPLRGEPCFLTPTTLNAGRPKGVGNTYRKLVMPIGS